MPETIVFHDANIIDCTGREPYSGTLVVCGERIQAVGTESQVLAPRDARQVDLGGRTVMPGLIDAHVHIASVEDFAERDTANRHPGAVYAYTVARNLETTLMHGFTTIRDAGGCHWSFKLAVERGMIPGPRTLVSNMYISQTGGHGDFRALHNRSDPRESWHPLMPPPAICDGVDQVRRVSREQLRTGADQLKVMAGGGAASPTDPVDAPQFTVEEIAAAVYEAKVVKKAVMAHVYVPVGIKNCVEAGVTTIEHGDFLDEESAFLMKEHGIFLVPTLSARPPRTERTDSSHPVVLDQGSRVSVSASEATHYPDDTTVESITFTNASASESVRIAMAVGVNIGSGSDVFGSNVDQKALELELKAAIMGAMDSLISATRTNAHLLGLEDQIGTLEMGKLADLIVVNGNPIEDITLLQDQQNIPLVMRSGRIAKDALK